MKKIILLTLIIILTACTSLQEVSKNSKEYHSKGYVEIRKNKQYVTIGTENIDKPILLYLHGGPGVAQTPITFPYFKELEKDFIVVFWDQRGAGKSFNGLKPMYQSLDDFVEDTKEITEYLLKKFNKEKLYVIGSSWGSILGMETIERYPNLYYAYVGAGQVVDMEENFKASYDLLLEEAVKNNDEKLMKKLKNINRENIKINFIGKPSFSGTKIFRIIRNKEKKEMMEIKKNRMRQNLGKEDVEKEFKEMARENNKKKKFAYNNLIVRIKANTLYNKLWNEIRNIDLNMDIPKVEIPVYFAGGKNDYHTPYTLLEEYFNALEAPKKELVWFEKSGHGPEYQEPEKFAELMRRVQKETLTK